MIKPTTYFIGKYKVEGIENYSTLEECYEYLKDKKFIGIDIETSAKTPQIYAQFKKNKQFRPGLDPYLTNIVMLQLGNYEKIFVIDVRDYSKEELQPIINFLNYNKDITLIGQNCLPYYTEVLTSKGWKLISEITTNDIVYGNNPITNSIEQQKINFLVQSIDEVYEFKNSQRFLSSTLGHRWLSKNRYGKISYKTAQELQGTRDSIILNTKFSGFNTKLNLTDEELMLFSWAITDGKIDMRKGVCQSLSITQSTKYPHIFNELQSLFEIYGQDFNLYDVKVDSKYKPIKRFVLKGSIVNEFLQRIKFTSKETFNFCDFVLNMSEHQLNIFIDCVNKAEGCKSNKWKGKVNKEDYRIAQIQSERKNTLRDAIALALYLKGYTIGVDNLVIRAKKRKTADLRTLKYESKGIQNVYCLNTPFSNFIIRQNEQIMITGNCKFEQKHLKHNYGINFYNVIDIMIQEMCLYNGLYRSFSLAGMSKEYLGVKSVTDFSLFDLEAKATLDDEYLASNEHLLTPFEVADEEQIDKGTRMEFVTIYNKPFTAKQILYGSDDILYPLLIAERQRLGRQLPNGEVYKPLTLFKLENQMVLVNADMELNGMPFKEEVWRDIEKVNHKEYTERLKELNSYVEQFYPKFVEEPNLFDFHRRCKIEWSSSKQVIELFRFLDICPREFSKQTKKEEWTVGAVALLKQIPNELKDAYNNQQWVGFDKDDSGSYIEDHSKLILAYLLMKRSEQAVTTFGLEWLKYVHPVTGRIHSNFRQILNSGRMASNNPNCLSLDTEVLTPTGWKKSNEVSVGEDIFSFNLNKKELEIQKINQVYHGRGNLIEVENNTHFNACLTDNHRNLFIDRKNGEFKVKTTNEFMKDAHILNASTFNEGINEDENFLTLLLATQADGTYHGNKIRFSFTKERKIVRLKRVLDILKIDYLHNKRRNSDIYEFYVSISEDYFKGYLKDKKLTYKLLNLSLSNRHFIIDEIHNWDGLHKQKSSYCSLLEENIDVLQAVHTITNTRSKVRMYKDKYFNLDVTRRNYTGTANSKLTNLGEDNVWCVSVDNSFIVCRRGGTTFITGNCQNLPQGVYRDAFALDSGSVISSDFGNQEMRTAACISGEEVMLQVFTEGHPIYDDDLHMATADSMNKALNPNADYLPKKGQEGFTNEIKKQRDRAKIVNFGILYGKEAKGFAQDFGMELEEAEDFIKNYFKAYPKLQVMMDKQAKDTFKNNYILINPMTDRRWFSSLFDEMNDYREKASEYFPEEYFSNRMPKEQKLKLKEELNTMYPEIKTYWRNFFGIRGSIQRKSTNYMVQGCIPASSNILTDKGFCKIGDFESGTVWTGYNWAPANKVARGEAEIIKLTLSNGYEFICDDRHKLLGLNSKGEEQMFDVLDMVGEKIIIDLKKSNCEWGSPINSVEDWYWFGRLVGDGWVTKRGHWGIIFNKNEYEDMNAFCQWLDSKDLITKTSPKTYKGYNIFYSNSKTKKACTREESTYCSVSLSSEDSHKLLKMWNIDKGFSSNKHLPPIVFSLDFERRKALFKGWYDADGRKYPSRGGIILDGKKYTRLSCSNKVLQQSLLKLTTTLGFLSKIFNYKNSTDIYFYTKPQQIFVKSIDYLGYKEETYTLTVHDHLHRFSNEGLISKNTSADETKTALVMIRKNFIEKNTHLKLINSVHDEILVETTNEKEEAIKDGELLAKLMVDGANVYLTPKIMTSNPEVGSCWVH